MSPRRIWYMRDNHTFVALPPEVDGAMARLEETFHGYYGTYGMLCTKTGPMRSTALNAGKEWSEFAPRARAWIEAALAPTDAEIEYASWFKDAHA